MKRLDSSSTTKPIEVTKDSIEYDIQIYITGFDNFLATQTSKNYYDIDTLKNKNILMVKE